MESKSEQHLSIKIENIMPIFKRFITNNDYKILKSKFEIPIRDKETDLLKYDVHNPFYANIDYFSKHILNVLITLNLFT